MSLLFPKRLTRLAFLGRLLAYYGLGFLFEWLQACCESLTALEWPGTFSTIGYILLGWFLLGGILPRVRDVGISPWLTLGFLVPGIEWALAAGLLAGPTDWYNKYRKSEGTEDTRSNSPARPTERAGWGGPQWFAVLLISAGLLLVLGGNWEWQRGFAAFLRIEMFLMFFRSYGLPLLLGGIGLLSWLGIGLRGFPGEATHAATRTALALALSFLLLAIISSWPFFSVKAGASIRPIGWSVLISMIALGSLATALPLGIRGIAKERHRALGALACVLALAPAPLAMSMLIYAGKICGFTLSP